MVADGPPRRLLELVRDGHADLVLPEPALAELRRVLTERLDMDDEAVDVIAALVKEVAVMIAEVPVEVHALSGDADDDRIIAAASKAGRTS